MTSSYLLHFFLVLENIRLLYFQRLLGATLLVFANKQDLPGSLSSDEIKEVRK